MRHLPFLLPLLVLVLSECTKAIVEYARSGHWHKGFFRPGGMPSTHSAFVTSVMITVAHARGADSIEFLLAFALASVVWYDAVTLRQSVGEQAEVLNHLQQLKHLTERVGHSFTEVMAGIAFGAVLTELGIWAMM